MADRVGSLVTELTTEFSQKKLLLDEQEKLLALERQRLTKEKEFMTKVEVSNQDIITLNVGGTVFTTKRGSLRLIPGSVLEMMFSGRWEERVERDKDGHVFLDLDPFLFSVVLRFLVAMHTYGAAAEHLELQPIPSHLEPEFRVMLRFLSLEDIIQPKIDFKWSSVFKAPSVRLTNGGTTAVSEGRRSLRHHVLSHDVFHGGLFKFNIFIECLDDWAMIGVLNGDARLNTSDDACRDPSTFGWGSSGEVFVNGVESSKQGYPRRTFKSGDRLSILLDCRYSTLALTAPIGDEMVEYKIPKVTGNNWRLVLATYFGSSAVEDVNLIDSKDRFHSVGRSVPAIQKNGTRMFYSL